jgi:hypothetical protein
MNNYRRFHQKFPILCPLFLFSFLFCFVFRHLFFCFVSYWLCSEGGWNIVQQRVDKNSANEKVVVLNILKSAEDEIEISDIEKSTKHQFEMYQAEERRQQQERQRAQEGSLRGFGAPFAASGVGSDKEGMNILNGFTTTVFPSVSGWQNGRDGAKIAQCSLYRWANPSASSDPITDELITPRIHPLCESFSYPFPNGLPPVLPVLEDFPKLTWGARRAASPSVKMRVIPSRRNEDGQPSPSASSARMAYPPQRRESPPAASLPEFSPPREDGDMVIPAGGRGAGIVISPFSRRKSLSPSAHASLSSVDGMLPGEMTKAAPFDVSARTLAPFSGGVRPAASQKLLTKLPTEPTKRKRESKKDREDDEFENYIDLDVDLEKYDYAYDRPDENESECENVILNLKQDSDSEKRKRLDDSNDIEMLYQMNVLKK